MGRRKAGFRKNHHFSHKNRGTNKQQTKQNKTDSRKPYSDIIRENDNFVKYYQIQNVCKKEEFEEFITSLKTDLPSTFRITGSKGVANKMLEIVQEQLIKDCIDQTDPSEKPPNIFPLPW
ncbi:hypothetical protein NQ314_018450 [Rhamnusium bicolor]|uniref:Uncharacterized protein n=1 Tax=Rhamnusium bicolor TaxID=1586634 RepID=A0AAV8WQW1_9CUCU|nr:hypothetical protein NQ314_018450 [Rhamnusium bicolor]